MKMANKHLALAFGFLLFFTAETQAQEGPRQDPSFTLVTRLWPTTGSSRWHFAGSGINVLSDLRWEKANSVVTEASGELLWNRLVFLASLGGSAISHGVLIDDDFGASNRQDRTSHTRSDTRDDYLFYINTDVGARIFTWSGRERINPGSVDLLLGYQHWRERYEAFGARGTTEISPRTKVLTEEFVWNSLRLGARAQIPVHGRVGLKLKPSVLFFSRFDLEDIHHLRTDLKKNPSFSARSQGGLGFQMEGALTYIVARRWSAEAGYRYWDLNSGRGDKFTHALTGTTKDRLNEGVSVRHGPFFALEYRF